MFACLYAPPRGLAFRSRDGVPRGRSVTDALVRLARLQSPCVEVHADNLVLLDATGLEDLVGDGRAFGATLRRAGAQRGLCLHIGVASTRTAALLIAQARSGLTVIEPGQEAAALAALPVDVLRALARGQARGVGGSARRPFPVSAAGLAIPAFALLSTVRRWGVRTLGDLAEQSPETLLDRLGPSGLALQRFARGVDDASLVPGGADQVFESRLTLETPVEGLEPLAFVLSRLFETVCARLSQAAAQAAAVRVRLHLATGEIHACRLTPAIPTREAKALRALALCDLEMDPPRGRVMKVAVVVEPAETGVRQMSLLDRPHFSPARNATLLSRLTALVGEGRCGSPALRDSGNGTSYGMQAFAPNLADTVAAHSRLGG